MFRSRVVISAVFIISLMNFPLTHIACSFAQSEQSSSLDSVKLAMSAAALSSDRAFGSVFCDIAQKITPAIVSVVLTKIDTVTFFKNPFYNFFNDSSSSGSDSPFDFFFRMPRSPKRGPDSGPDVERRAFRQQAQGSGVIVSSDGYVLTNYHVVSGAGELQIKLADDRTFDAIIVGSDSLSDVAVIKIKNKVKNLPTAPLGDDSSMRPGEWVLAVGNPFNLTSTVTHGIISARNRTVGNTALYQNYLQTDAAINPGNSGGALVNMEGKVIGINTMIYTETGGFMGIGFAIPITMARRVMNELIQKGRVTRGWMGISVQDLTDAMREVFGSDTIKGVLVGEVYKNQPGEKAGLRRGDVILSIDGKKTRNANDLRMIVAELPPGKAVPVSIIRNGQKMIVQCVIRERDEKEIASYAEKTSDQPSEVSSDKSLQKFGLSVGDLTPLMHERYGISKEVNGVVIVGVDQMLTDDRATLREGDVIVEVKVKNKNVQPIGSLKDLISATGHLQNGDPVLLLISRAKEVFYVAFKLP
jgi:serine protease Do